MKKLEIEIDKKKKTLLAYFTNRFHFVTRDTHNYAVIVLFITILLDMFRITGLIAHIFRLRNIVKVCISLSGGGGGGVIKKRSILQ